ncbi:hypothetical protein ABZ613_06390 [Streptomyces collinus]|uniref:hypothetical protein n=1 Tax=Streptomyces collinus TaxID=42684 RepID=UPI0033CDF81B
MYTIIVVLCCVAVLVGALAAVAWRLKQPVYTFTALGVAAATLAAAVVVPLVNSEDSAADDDARSSDITLDVEDNTQVDLCMTGVHGTGRAAEGESLALLVRGLNDAQYYLTHRIPDAQNWSVPRFRVGAVDSPSGTPYELVVWKFDSETTRLVERLTKAQFGSRPSTVHEVVRRKVIRRAADKDHC